MAKYAIITDWRKYDREFAVIIVRTGKVLLQTNDKERALEFVQGAVDDDRWCASNRD